MSTFIEQLKELKVTVSSPESAVTASRSDDGYAFTIDPDVARHLDEAALAGEIEAAWTTAMQRHTAQARRILIDRWRDRPDTSGPTEPAVARKARYRELMSDIEVTQRSPRDLVRVALYGDGELYVTITPGAVMRMGGGYSMLEAEVTAAVNGAMADFRAQRRVIHKNVYDRPGGEHG